MRRLGIALAGMVVVCSLAGNASAVVRKKVPLWPVFRLEETDDQKNMQILWPLLDIRKTPDETRYWVLVLNSYRRFPKRDATEWNVLWPIGQLSYSDNKTQGRVFPFFAGKRGNNRHMVLFPLLWWFWEVGDEYTFFLLPWGRHAEPDGDHFTALTPLFVWKNGDRRSGLVLPIAYWDFDEENDFTFYLFPFFRDVKQNGKVSTGFIPWWVTKREDREFANLFPVIWAKEDGEYKTFLVLPLFYKIKDDAVFFPLYWDFENLMLFFPFYGKGKRGPWEWESIIPPLFIRWGDEDYQEKDVLWPFVIVGDGENRERLVVRPLYEYRREGEYVQRGALLNALAMGKGGDRSLVRVAPFYSDKHKGDRRDLSILWPVYQLREEPDVFDRRLLSLLPIGLFDIQEPSRSTSFLNLAWVGKGAEGARHGFYPLYSYTERDGDTRFCLLDLWQPLDTRFFEWSDLPIIPDLTYIFKIEKDDNGDQTWKAPLHLFRWIRTERGHRSLRVGTFFVFDWSRWEQNDSRELHLLTLFWDNVNRGRNYRSQGFWPLYTFRKTKQDGVKGSFLDPLPMLWEGEEEDQHVSAFLKILDYRKKPNGDSRFSFLWRTYRREKQGDNLSVEAFPFLNWEKSPDAKSFRFLWKLFAYENEGGDKSLTLFFLPKIGL